MAKSKKSTRSTRSTKSAKKAVKPRGPSIAHLSAEIAQLRKDLDTALVRNLVAPPSAEVFRVESPPAFAETSMAEMRMEAVLARPMLTPAVDISGTATIAPFEETCPPFEAQPLPWPDATSGPFLAVPGHENFAGGGYADRARTRPAGLFGFSSKLHDFGYSCNDLEFFRGPRCKLELSRFAKIDYIFTQLNKKVWNQLRVASQFSGWLSGLFFRGHPENFLPNDEFVNVLNDPKLDVIEDYFMVPYRAIPAAERSALTKPWEHLVEQTVGGRIIGRRMVVDQVPDYNKPTPYDAQKPWRIWAEETYGTALWQSLCSINSSTGAEFLI
ncbi:MAG: hypothetical protein H7144_07145 [Burkholderiales bacterium]|nr:hypothetical protein [Phycisphaerae bacterium]